MNDVLEHFTDAELTALGEGLTRELYAADPVHWVREVLGEELWSRQAEIARSVVAHRYTAVHACHDSGKSYAAARIACWWISTHPVGEAIVVTSAPTLDQVRAILWREMREAHAHGGLPGTMNQMQWIIQRRIVGIGRKPADWDQAAFQGIHDHYVLVILDEASGLGEQLWTAAETLVTNDASRILAIGNPDDPVSHFAKVCKPGSGWNTIGISAFDTPNFSGEQVPDRIRPLLLSPAWVEEHRRWGEDSPYWISKVLGRFPDRSDDALVPLSWIERARCAELPREGPTFLGVDVARYGAAQTVVMSWQGGVVRAVASRSHEDTMQTSGLVARALVETGAAFAVIDAVGVGGGVVDRLCEQDLPVIGVDAGWKTRDSTRFLNARAEWYWGLREIFERGEIDIDPADEELAQELSSVRYKHNSSGRIQIESKEDMRARGISSPDRADALMLSTLRPCQRPSWEWTDEDERAFEAERVHISDW